MTQPSLSTIPLVRNENRQVQDISVFYMTLPTDSADQAVSLTEYLNQHGVMAAREGTEMVTCPMEVPTLAAEVYNLHRSWKRFWEYSDSGLFGLPVYHKP